MSFLDRVELCLNTKNITPYRMCKDLNIPPTTYSGWKKGQQPSSERLAKIAKYFNVSTDYLLGITDDPQAPATITPTVLETAEAIKIAFEDMLGHKPSKEELQKFKELAQVFFDKFKEEHQ